MAKLDEGKVLAKLAKQVPLRIYETWEDEETVYTVIEVVECTSGHRITFVLGVKKEA